MILDSKSALEVEGIPTFLPCISYIKVVWIRKSDGKASHKIPATRDKSQYILLNFLIDRLETSKN